MNPLRSSDKGVSTGRRRLVLAAIALATVGFLSSSVVSSAVAGTAQSAWGYKTIGGTTYANLAKIDTYAGSTNPWARATTLTQKNGGGTPAGWAGSRGRLFTSGGSLSCEGTTTYNAANQYATGLSCLRSGHGAWHSYGVSYGWNGSGYNSFYTYKSPNQNS